MVKLLLILHIYILCTHIISGFTYREITAKSNREQHTKKSSIDYPSDVIDGNVELPLSVPYIQWSARRRIFNRRYCCLLLKASNDDDSGDKDGGKKKGYRFGDFTKGITKSLIGDKVEKVCMSLIALQLALTKSYYAALCRLLASHTSLEIFPEQ